jgi:hypothetical protein
MLLTCHCTALILVILEGLKHQLFWSHTADFWTASSLYTTMKLPAGQQFLLMINLVWKRTWLLPVVKLVQCDEDGQHTLHSQLRHSNTSQAVPPSSTNSACQPKQLNSPDFTTQCNSLETTELFLILISTPGPQCGRKDYVNEKFQWYHR